MNTIRKVIGSLLAFPAALTLLVAFTIAYGWSTAAEIIPALAAAKHRVLDDLGDNDAS